MGRGRSTQERSLRSGRILSHESEPQSVKVNSQRTPVKPKTKNPKPSDKPTAGSPKKSQAQMDRSDEQEQQEETFRIQEILEEETRGKSQVYKVRWDGRPHDDNWQDAAEVQRLFPEVVQAWLERQAQESADEMEDEGDEEEEEEEEFVIDRIEQQRTVKGELQYYVHYVGHSRRVWESAEAVKAAFPKVVDEFMVPRPLAVSPKKSPKKSPPAYGRDRQLRRAAAALVAASHSRANNFSPPPKPTVSAPPSDSKKRKAPEPQPKPELGGGTRTRSAAPAQSKAPEPELGERKRTRSEQTAPASSQKQGPAHKSAQGNEDIVLQKFDYKQVQVSEIVGIRRNASNDDLELFVRFKQRPHQGPFWQPLRVLRTHCPQKVIDYFASTLAFEAADSDSA